MQIEAQLAEGVYQNDIANELGAHPKTVSRALKRVGSPSGKHPAGRRSKMGGNNGYLSFPLSELTSKMLFPPSCPINSYILLSRRNKRTVTHKYG